MARNTWSVQFRGQLVAEFRTGNDSRVAERVYGVGNHSSEVILNRARAAQALRAWRHMARVTQPAGSLTVSREA